MNYKIENELNRVDYGFISKKKRKKLGREWDKERIELYKSDFNRSFEILKSEIQSIKENGVDYGMWKRDNFSERI